MGRHSAADEDEDEGLAVLAAEAEAEAEAGAAADRRGRHSRGEDVAETGPVPGVPVRGDAERAALQDERPTQQLALADIAAAGPWVVTGEPGGTEAGGAQAGAITEPVVPLEPAEAPELLVPLEPGPPPEGAAAEPEPVPAAKGLSSTAADLALLREHPEVRNRVIAAALVPFVLYVVVLLVVGAAGVRYLLWLWVPMVTAGVLAGLILDRAHRKHGSRG